MIDRHIPRAGTAMGAMISEAEFAHSQPGVISKPSIALQEENESDNCLKGVMKDQRGLRLGFPEAKILPDEMIRILVGLLRRQSDRSEGC